MDVLSGLSILSSGVRMARSLISAKAQHSGKPFVLEPGKSIGAQLIEGRDLDGDGRLTMDELGAARTIFERLDGDGDGLLTATEINEGVLQAQRTGRIERAIAHYMELHDSDHDSLISEAESGVEKDVFEMIDMNDDGFLNRGELMSAYRRQKMDLSA